VINVAAAITYTGISALDVLERSPSVQVNRVQNIISINSKEGVIVMINGKRNYMDMASVIEMLAGMPSGNVDRIEIITTPPANFDADGTAGVINIVLKSNAQYGTNGSYTLTAGYSKGDVESGSFNINHRKEKLNIFGNLFFFTHESPATADELSCDDKR
jgi:outer membrane receptor protein involved in Fe transport